MRWPKDGLDKVKGKRVAVVGCAAAAIQLVPKLAQVAGQLTVYHRTANHIVERDNTPHPPELLEKWKKNPIEYRLYRAQFEQDFAQAWYEAGFKRDSEGYRRYIESARRNLESNIKDESLRRTLWPDFQLWCRRLLFHSDFYPSIARENVELVQQRIVRIEKDGIVTADQDSRDKVIDPNAKELKREHDVIVCKYLALSGSVIFDRSDMLRRTDYSLPQTQRVGLLAAESHHPCRS
jgi:cation diffusion facilitator CzcD-associated flavoprotein CzcO